MVVIIDRSANSTLQARFFEALSIYAAMYAKLMEMQEQARSGYIKGFRWFGPAKFMPAWGTHFWPSGM